jgi:SAM-dependent methyltransferase
VEGTQVNFATAWSRMVCTDGWLTECEGRVLFEQACALPEGSTIVEVGTYRGRSAALLAQSGHKVIAVDPLISGFGERNGMRVIDSDEEKLRAIVDRFPNIEWIRAHSHECIPMHSIDMLYIDGDHFHPSPLRDFRHFRRSMKPGGIVAFHDYNRFQDVTETIDYLEQSQQIVRFDIKKDMYVGRIPVLRNATHVTGINMLVMCRHFGRRCKLFLRSLQAQVGLSIPIDISLFFSRIEDQALFMQEWKDRDRLHLRTVACADEDIMQRAVVFATHIPEPVHSHMLYTDCDLWFPPTFFAEYTKLLDAEKQGYWGAWVQDIPEPDAEMLLGVEEPLKESTLCKYAVGLRYNWGKGVAGHFQCVPHQLASYPDDPIRGVNKADDIFATWAIANSNDQREERRLGAVTAYHFGHPYSWQGSDVQL